VEIIHGADHFYLGKEKELTDILRKHIIKFRDIEFPGS
jgi:alpha/beta superfamily hydrolase